MPNHCQVIVVGHVGKDPESARAGEYDVCRFSVATARKRKAGDLTTWWNCTAWRKDAEIAAKYLHKGDAVMVIGEAYMEEWQGNDGAKRQTMKVDVQRIVLLGGKRDHGDAEPAARPATTGGGAVPAADDPPFIRMAEGDEP